MPGIAELLSCGADLTALRLLASTDRSALAASLKELGYAKMGHRMELEKALLLEPPAVAPSKPPVAAPGKPPAKPPAEALGTATVARVARLLAAEAAAVASAGEAAAAERLWGQVAVLSPALATERPLIEARAARPEAEATVAAVVEVAAPEAVPEAAAGELLAESAVQAAASAQAASLRAEGSEAYRDGRHGRAEVLYTQALAFTPGAPHDPPRTAAAPPHGLTSVVGSAG